MKVTLFKTLGIVTGSKDIRQNTIDLNVGTGAMSFELTKFLKDDVYVDSIAKIKTIAVVTSAPTALGVVFDMLKEKNNTRSRKTNKRRRK
jgi:sorbitol-specific phosphotransferase system component IIBC